MQAVVVIHWMGQQIPLDTIKGFVRAVWENSTEVWSKADARTGSLELRRITTRESIASTPEFPAGVRTDFYELHWADRRLNVILDKRLALPATWSGAAKCPPRMASIVAWISGQLRRNTHPPTHL